MGRIIILVSLSLLLSTTAQAQYLFNGTISDIITEKALEDCVIQIHGFDAPYFSYEGGKFQVPLPKYDVYRVNITKEGYGTYNEIVTVKSNDPIAITLTPRYLMDTTTNANMVAFTDATIVQATRADKTAPSTYSIVTKEDIQKENLGQDLPYLLESEPAVVVTSDGGSGVGYTSMRIRGSDMSRINFTINGIPYNDSESQGVFLVNLPDFSSSIKDIQIQRGVGTSTNGAATFGASININTNELTKKPYGELSTALGSFSTFKNTLQFGTGLINKHFTFDGRLSRITSDGYIDRASSELMSYYLSGGYYGDNTILRFNTFSGKEITYQAWNGIDATTLANDRTFNSSGTDFGQKEVPYDNEVDNYKQDHYQLFLSQTFAKNWTANVGVHYTKGKGYFEQYKVDQDYTDYNLNEPVVGGVSVPSTDLIRRRWLDNHFYGTTYSVNYKKSGRLNATLGGAWNQYDGDHFGELIWAENGTTGEIRDRYYDNNGLKTEFNIFVKFMADVTKKLLFYGDLQYRNVAYSASGIDNDQRYIFVDKDYGFFNPKIGLTYKVNGKHSVYTSFAIANREPTRNDFIDAPNGETPLPETLSDLEAGYKYNTKSLQFNANYYLMKYVNQLVLTGAINDVGSLVRSNVTNSFRTGIEADMRLNLADVIGIRSNIAWSVNEITEFTETDPSGMEVLHDNSKISYSPQWVGAFNFELRPVKSVSIELVNKFVGKQFLDNTSNNNLALERYVQNDIRLSYNTSTKLLKDIEFTLLVNNYTNRLFESNGYVYFGEAYYYPQAGTNFLLGLRTRF